MNDAEFTLIEHLEEFRKRIIIAISAWAIASILGYFFTPNLISLLTKILGKPLVFFHPTDAFMVKIKLSILSGFFLAIPIILYQVILFIYPALKKEEKKLLFKFLPLSILLFLTGITFAYFIFLPLSIKFLMGFATENLKPMISINEYLSLVVSMLILFGLVFELPLILFSLSLTGILNSDKLKKGRKYAILIIFILAAIITPTPDAFTQTFLALPLWLLYELSILFMRSSKR